MQFNLKKIFQILNILIFLNCINLYAQETPPAAPEELSLDAPDSLEAELMESQPSQETGTVPTEAALEAPAPPAEGMSKMSYDTEDLQVDSIEQQYAMNGFSIGFVMYNQNYNIHAGVLAAKSGVTQTYDISSSSSNIQSAGGVIRYAILPYNKVGTDINISYSSSLNHTDAGLSPITAIKGELNIGYAFQPIHTISVYLLAGAGYEVIYGNDIEKVLIPGGGLVQIGGGFGLGEKFNIEAFYAHSEHHLSQKFIDNAVSTALSNGFTTANLVPEQSVTSDIIHARVTFTY